MFLRNTGIASDFSTASAVIIASELDVTVDIHPSFTGLKVEEAKNFLGTNTIEHSGGPLPLYPHTIVPKKDGNLSTSVPHQSQIA